MYKMRKIIIFILIAASVKYVKAQTISQKLATAYKQFENESQLKHAISSLYVIDATTGKVVFDKNSQIGLAPASSQKVITAATAFELLGRDFRYKTEFGYGGEISDSILFGSVYIQSNGDPTLGSQRFKNTSSALVESKFVSELHKRNIFRHNGALVGIIGRNEDHSIPDGWVWQDIGNYYGAASGGLNWNENQFDLILKPGKKEGDSVKLIRAKPVMLNEFVNCLKTGKKNSGDNAYIYFEPGSHSRYITGTIPCCVDSFTISGSAFNSNYFTLGNFADILRKNQFRQQSGSFNISVTNEYFADKPVVNFYTHYSPSLDSIIYWFLKKSINLYGEALIKTMAYEKKGFGATDTGVNVIKGFWKQKGLDPNEINIYDGSGLSPMNRVTPHAQVEVLKYAMKQNWFRYFYDALPEYNGMKLKSGTIGDVKAFCGYHTSRDGKNYIISFIVNNYSGSSSTLVNKMYRVLDVLK
jgi:serine-type D-Ala-D-Ala carboxypeptidase/endopeptidase (penicillin-binding protein 4)